MRFTTDRETLLRALQLVTGVVERRQTLPVLSNLLVVAEEGRVSLTGTDLEVELVAHVSGLDVSQPGQCTIPARKLSDIWRSLPESSSVQIHSEGDRATVRSGRSRFALATLPATGFPAIEGSSKDLELRVGREDLQRLIGQTQFCMAQQDVRYYLNGMLLEVTRDHVRTVASDGHRMAKCTVSQQTPASDRHQVIVPRKGVIELSRLLADSDAAEIVLTIGRNHLRASVSSYTMTTKLVDGRFPDYEKVFPKSSKHTMTGDRETLKQAFQRAAILSNEKYRGVRLILDRDQLTIQANNPEQEEAEEVVAVEYGGEHLEIGFNASYLQDVLGVLGTESVRLMVTDANSTAVLEGPGAEDAVFIIMPMRL
jgi:DNA polymerase-3 subunit beta